MSKESELDELEGGEELDSSEIGVGDGESRGARRTKPMLGAGTLRETRRRLSREEDSIVFPLQDFNTGAFGGKSCLFVL